MMQRIVLGLALAAAVSGCRGEQQPVVSDTSCRIALAYMKDFNARARGRIGIWPWITMPSAAEVDAYLAERTENTSSEEVDWLRAAAPVRDVRVADHCPEIRAWLDSVGAVRDEAELRRLTDQKNWPIALLSLSVPIVSKTGDSASFLVEESRSGHDDGPPLRVVYRRGADGQWRKAGLR